MIDPTAISKATDIHFGKSVERKAAELLLPFFGDGPFHLGMVDTYADLDWLVLDEANKLMGAIEVKHRRISKDAYDSMIISMRKHEAAKALWKFFKVKTLAVVVYTDGLGAFDLRDEPDGQRPVVRADRSYSAYTANQYHAEYLHSRLTYYPELFALLVADRN